MSITNSNNINITTNVAHVALLMSMLVSGLLLVGCGQKGSLYLNETANPNVDFIVYKQNKEAVSKGEAISLTKRKSLNHANQASDSSKAGASHNINPYTTVYDDLDNPNNY